MGRTLPSATQVFLEEEAYYTIYKRALCRADQGALEELFDIASWHIAEAGYAAHPLPMRIYLLAMLLEEQKELRRLREIVAGLSEASGIQPDDPTGK